MAGEVTRVTKFFFDTKLVTDAIDVKTRRAFIRFGSRVRRTAQFSMRSSGKKADKKAQALGFKYASAPAGQAPFAHGDKLLKKLISFYYDPKAKTVVVGPEQLPSLAKLKIPKLMEFGGTITEYQHGKPVTLQVSAHPYMKPAGDKNYDSVTDAYKGPLKLS